MIITLKSLIRLFLSSFFGIGFAFLSKYLSALQVKGDLEAYREVYSIAINSSSFPGFYIAANAFENVRDVLYAFVVYVSAHFLDFDQYLFSHLLFLDFYCTSSSLVSKIFELLYAFWFCEFLSLSMGFGH